MALVVNNKLVFLSDVPAQPQRKYFRKDNTYISWGINALVRYWHCEKPSEFKYNKNMEKPITKEEKRKWGI